MSHLKELRALKNQIAVTRAKMIELWRQRGHTDPDVLAVSIKLDKLINRYQQITYLKDNRESRKLLVV